MVAALSRDSWVTPDADSPDLAHIAAELRPLAVPVDLLMKLPDNPRQGDVGAVGASIDRFTQRVPIVVNALTGHVEAGNTRFEAIAAAGLEWVAAVLVEDDPTSEKAYSIADNRAHDLGLTDDALLAKLLLELHEDDPSAMHAAGFDDDDLDALVADVMRDTNPALAAALAPQAFASDEHSHPEPSMFWDPKVKAYEPTPAAAAPASEIPGPVMVTLSIAVPRELRHPLTRRLRQLMNETATMTMGDALATHFKLLPES